MHLRRKKRIILQKRICRNFFKSVTMHRCRSGDAWSEPWRCLARAATMFRDSSDDVWWRLWRSIVSATTKHRYWSSAPVLRLQHLGATQATHQRCGDGNFLKNVFHCQLSTFRCFCLIVCTVRGWQWKHVFFYKTTNDTKFHSFNSWNYRFAICL